MTKGAGCSRGQWWGGQGASFLSPQGPSPRWLRLNLAAQKVDQGSGDLELAAGCLHLSGRAAMAPLKGRCQQQGLLQGEEGWPARPKPHGTPTFHGGNDPSSG